MSSSTTNINCWEYTKCGREPGGVQSESLGICPAAILKNFDKTNNGENGGRICWFVDETNCMEQSRGVFIDRFEHCQKCNFFLLVQKQENRHLVVVRNDVPQFIEGKSNTKHIEATPKSQLLSIS